MKTRCLRMLNLRARVADVWHAGVVVTVDAAGSADTAPSSRPTPAVPSSLYLGACLISVDTVINSFSLGRRLGMH